METARLYATPSYARAVRAWLILLMSLVALMVFIGGVTRLTESGLSIVEWKLLSGVFPPLTDEGWNAEFEAYKASPEFEKKNFEFAVGDFKKIFWLEYIHRLLGRVVGLAFIAPFGFFLMRRAMSPALNRRMFCATLLVGMQGAVGWIMVQSGLIDAPRVSPIKLALHLSLAFGLFALLLWTFWQITPKERVTATLRYARLVRVAMAVLIIQIIFGAIVAGNDAGLTYNTYPLMDGKFIPSGLALALNESPVWYGDPLIVQFMHRSGAHLLAILIVVVAAIGMKEFSPVIRKATFYLALAFVLQFILGVLTLLHVVPIHLASAHQMVALLLLSTLLWPLYLTAKPQAH